MGGSVAREIFEFKTYADFIDAGGASAYGDGTVIIAGAAWTVAKGEMFPAAGATRREGVIRVVFFGDSTAEYVCASTGANAFNNSALPNMDAWDKTFSSTGTITRVYGGGYGGDALMHFYPKAYPVANFGIGGETLATMLARDNNPVTANRRAISDLANFDFDVIIVRAGINNFNGASAGFSSATYANLNASHVQPGLVSAKALLDRLLAYGKPVLWDSLFGYSVANGTAPQSRLAINAFNTEMRKYCETKYNAFFVETNTRAADGNWKNTATTYTTDGLHESSGATWDISAAEASKLTEIFGPSYPWRYEDYGTNIFSNPNLVTCQSATVNGVAGTHANPEVGYSLSSTTGANAKIEYRNNKTWQTVELTATAAAGNFTLTMYQDFGAMFAINDYVCIEFDIILEPLTPATVLPTFTSLYGQVQLTGAASNLERFQVKPENYAHISGSTGITMRCVHQPIKINTSELLTGSIYNHTMSVVGVFTSADTVGHTSDKFKLWMSAPVIIKLAPAQLT